MANRINRISPSSLAPRTELIVEPCKDGSGNWYWCLKVDGGVYADGEAIDEATANTKVVDCYDDWCEKQ